MGHIWPVIGPSEPESEEELEVELVLTEGDGAASLAPEKHPVEEEEAERGQDNQAREEELEGAGRQ